MSVLAAKQAQLTAKLDEADALQKGFTDDPASHTPEAQEKFAGILEEVKTLENDIQTVKHLEKAREAANEEVPQRKAYSPAVVTELNEHKSIGEQFVESAAYKEAVKNRGGRVEATHEAKGFFRADQSKATFNLAAVGLSTTTNYSAGPIMIEQQRLTIRDLLAVGQTTQNSIAYFKESSFTNAATAVAEEGLKPEATLALEEVTTAVRKIAVIGRVTDEMWQDFPMIRDYVNNRLRFMVQQTEEAQLLNGSGTAPNLRGILNTTGIQTQALGGDTVPDAIYKAITKIRVPASSVGGYEPNGMVIHPNDWQAIRLSKDGNNQYYAGGPFMGQYGVGGIAADSIWGKPVVVTTAITEGTALVGDFRTGAQIWQREGITVEATNTHEDDFQYNRMAIRVEERLALAVYRPSAFCTVTGI